MISVSPRFAAQLETLKAGPDCFIHEKRYAAFQAGEMSEQDFATLCCDDPAFDGFVSGADWLRDHPVPVLPYFTFHGGHIFFKRDPDRKSGILKAFPPEEHDDFLEQKALEIIALMSPYDGKRIERICEATSHLLLARLQYMRANGL